ncbi:hypothetical protein KC887_07320 [Candidatus Kaiserbacteria bacterium]|nr:hypothetical protein [Candidatus Kaiserbacteria bacterium]
MSKSARQQAFDELRNSPDSQRMRREALRKIHQSDYDQDVLDAAYDEIEERYQQRVREIEARYNPQINFFLFLLLFLLLLILCGPLLGSITG